MSYFFTHTLLRLFVISLLGASLPTHAAWWEFGRSSNEPVITDLKLGKIDAVLQDERLTLSLDDLENGQVTVFGRAEVSKGAIGLMEISLDGGETWQQATLGDRGMFTYVFRPDINREYNFVARAITTSGQSTDIDEHSFILKVRPMRTLDEAKQVFADMLKIYTQENRAAFMRLISNDFEGITSALEEAIVSDFRLLDNITIQPNISRIVEEDDTVEISFTYNRQVQSARTGLIVRDSAASSATFKREGESFKLVRLAAPLIFGVSFPEDVASTVAHESVGQQVLQISSTTGSVSTAPQQTTIESTATQTGTVTLSSQFVGSPTDTFEGFTFDSDSKSTETNPATMTADIGYIVFEIEIGAGVRAVAVNNAFDSITAAPTSGYSATPIPEAQIQVGKVFAFELPGPRYAVIEITAVNVINPGVGTMTFRYKYQPSGSTAF